ncbi:unnamed protein product [Tilletia controversa]|uniref:Catabolite repression protein creC n=1 Tax=Tilletia controversa TaxID=13291 RepID=A0A8X7SZJ0_9BASI|nr:hypothetical protein CF328_g1058 [Tilletia controversa]KAE8253910.1 hypothetical protein A4X06_0g1161 [Tilletia controversa]CAD6905250.1 unnamed protein product [Tilletia controversa]CAD6911857.1 unnamed protein product [Tilletia controversa]CAD6947792.1 unnamed protein product [Tilletia controversa]
MATFGASIASAGGAGANAGNLSANIGFGTGSNNGGGGSGGGSGASTSSALSTAAVLLSAVSPAAPKLDAPEGPWLLASSLPPPQPLLLSNNVSISTAAPLPYNLQPRLSSSNNGDPRPSFDHGPVDGHDGSNQAQERAKKLPRPRQNVRSTSSTFINRVQGHADLTKLLAARMESDSYSFLNVGRTFVWLADTSGRVKEPLMRITFTSAPTCHDVNAYTRSNDRLDVIIGFASTGDLLWIDPISSKYTRINKGGAVSSSGVSQVRWLPPAVGSDLMFMATHADGTVIIYDATRDDPQQGQFVPGIWTPKGSVFPNSAMVAQTGIKASRSVKDRKFKKKDKGRPSTASSSIGAFNSNTAGTGQPMTAQLSATSYAMSGSDALGTDDDAQEVLDNASVSTGDGQAFTSHRRSQNPSTSSTATVQPLVPGSPYAAGAATNNASSSSLDSAKVPAANGESERQRRGSAASFLDRPLAIFSGGSGSHTHSRGRTDTSGSMASQPGGHADVPILEGQFSSESRPWDSVNCIIVTRPGFGTFTSPRGNDSVGAPSLLPGLFEPLNGHDRGATAEEETGGWASLSVPGKNKDASWVKYNPVSHWHVSRKRITDFAFSPDLVHVALTSEDGNLRIMDLGSERLLDTYRGYFGSLTCVCWSPDGRFLLTGGQDDLVTVWAPREGRIIARCQGHSSFVTDISFDSWRWRPEERSYRFASVGEDCKLIFWDFSSAALKRPKGHGHGGGATASHSHSHLHSGAATGTGAFRKSMVGSTFSLLDRQHMLAHRGSVSGPSGMRGSMVADRQFLGYPMHADVEPVVHTAPARSEVAMLQPVVVQQVSGPAVMAALASGGPTAQAAATPGSVPSSYASTTSSGPIVQAAAGSASTTQDILVVVRFDPSEVVVVRKSGQIDSYARPPAQSGSSFSVFNSKHPIPPSGA